MTRDDTEALRAILRRGDPAADGSEPTAAELARMRERILRTRSAVERGEDGAGEVPWYRSPRRTLTVAVVAALVAAALGAEFWLRRAAVDASRPAGPASAHEALSAEPTPSAAAGRQIHFTTPGGTRIVWVLYPPPNPAGTPTDTGWDRDGRGPGGS
jgi:hypothetical protein